MGCDIHLHIELKINEKWEHYNNPFIHRDAHLFYLMDGYREKEEGCPKPIIKSRGLPENISTITQIDYEKWKSDAHNISWFGLEEIEKLYRNYEKSDLSLDYDFFGYLFGNGYSTFRKYKHEYPKKIKDVRFVFWFDN